MMQQLVLCFLLQHLIQLTVPSPLSPLCSAEWQLHIPHQQTHDLQQQRSAWCAGPEGSRLVEKTATSEAAAAGSNVYIATGYVAVAAGAALQMGVSW